jgi:hypothetical protein
MNHHAANPTEVGSNVRKRKLKHSADWLESRDNFCARSTFRNLPPR